MSNASVKRYRQRNPRGSQIVDFAAALIVLAVFVFVPMVDLTILPFRWMLAQRCVEDFSRRLALSESFSQAQSLIDKEPSLETRLATIGGIKLTTARVYMQAVQATSGGTAFTADSPRTFSDAWLPNGKKSPCSYSVVLEAYASVSPAILIPSNKCSIPGLTTPVTFAFRASHPWENFGRDPYSGKFFLNE